MTKLTPNMRMLSAHRGQTQLTLIEVAAMPGLTSERELKDCRLVYQDSLLIAFWSVSDISASY